MTKHTAILLPLFLLVCAAAAAEPVIDDSPTRVQTTLSPGLVPVGTLVPKSVNEISTSRWTIGCEVLDREYASYDSYKEYLAPLGICRIRLQGGWARTEKEPGIYDFAWLDYIIDDARSRGLEIWFETSYGNPIYPGGGGRSLAGGIPTSEEGLAAWDKWVTLTARRYKDKIHEWCVWNEPNFGLNPPETFFAFTVRTAEVIKREIPDAEVSALALMQSDYDKVGPFLEYLKQRDKLDLISAIVYHHYTPNPDTAYPPVEKMREVIRSYSPTIRLWQGESGTMSQWGPIGALNRYPWTELTQAKWDTRRMLGDFGHGADSGVFTIADFEYRTTSWLNGINTKGLIKTDRASKGFKVLKVKTAYYAVQNVVSVFNDNLQLLDDADPEVQCEKQVYARTARFVDNLRPLIFFWDMSSVPADTNQTTPATITAKGMTFDDPVWVDLITGDAYAIAPEMFETTGGENPSTIFHDIPVYDAPVFITDRANLDLEKSEYVKFLEAEKAKNK